MHWVRAVMVVVFSVLAASGVQAQFLPEERFDPQRLTGAEKRYLQAALSFSGDYRGQLDGAWGRGSQSALDAYARRETRASEVRVADIRRLIARFSEEVAVAGWTARSVPGLPLSHLLPAAALERDRSAEGVTLVSRDGALILRGFDSSDGSARQIHNRLFETHVGRDAPYTLRGDDIWITAVETYGGQTVYLRTDWVAGHIHSRFVQMREGQNARGQLIIASLKRGPQAGLDLPGGGYLAAIARERRSVAPVATGGNGGGGIEPTAGTGFFVNNTDLVTAFDVVDGCRSIRLGNGAALDLIGADRGRGLAVLEAPARRKTWLAIGGDRSPGGAVTAAGFARNRDRGIEMQRLSLSGTPTIRTATDRIGLAAQFGPNLRGAPMLSDGGMVDAVVVGAPPEVIRLGRIGVEFRNFSFAVKGADLRAFLDDQRVAYTTGRNAGTMLDTSNADDIRPRLAAILCSG